MLFVLKKKVLDNAELESLKLALLSNFGKEENWKLIIEQFPLQNVSI
jgi:hypothetical protein